MFLIFVLLLAVPVSSRYIGNYHGKRLTRSTCDPSGVDCCPTGELSAFPAQLNKFFVCMFNAKYSLTCASGTVFDPINQNCVIDDWCVGKGCGFYPASPNDPTAQGRVGFFLCMRGWTFFEQCPAGTIVDESSTTPSLIPCKPLHDDPCDGQADNFIIFPDPQFPNQPRKYVECLSGVSVHKECPVHQVATIAGCVGTVPVNFGCNRQGYYPCHEVPNQYIFCQTGPSWVESLHACPTGEVWCPSTNLPVPTTDGSHCKGTCSYNFLVPAPVGCSFSGSGKCLHGTVNGVSAYYTCKWHPSIDDFIALVFKSTTGCDF